ncbi:MAG: glutaredoxin family protein [Hyphomicrobiales bacterium]
MAARPVVTLYSRDGCGLCDEALHYLREFASRLGFDIAVVDITTDDELHRRYMFEIPVITLEGREIARAPIYKTKLHDQLTEALHR